MKRTLVATAALVLSAGVTLAVVQHRQSRQPTRPVPPKHVVLDLDTAVKLSLPKVEAGLKPAAFRTPDGRAGWVLRIPGDRPIATPAYADGLLFVGGGYGSHEFYAFDAVTGEVAWKVTTKDDGPTAAVVEDGCVAFNTESCTVCVYEARTGKRLWEEWLGDPLMSQPAISKGRLYMAYPAGQRGGGQQQMNVAPNMPAAGQQQVIVPPPPQQSSKPPAAAKPGASNEPYRLLCADLHTGHHYWTAPIAADVISAPVIEGDRVLLTCMDGTSYSIDTANGHVVWKKQNAGTSAPLVANGRIVMTQKEVVGGQAKEGIARLEMKAGGATDKGLLAKSDARYFEVGKGQSVALNQKAQQSLDSSVGFGGGAPAGAQMEKAKSHLNVGSVAGGWAYQGSRVAYKGGQLLNAQGGKLNAVRAKDGSLAWQAEAKGKGITGDAQIFSPPALGRKNMYLCTAQGHLVSVGQADGKKAFLYRTDQPMAFQPALARGNLYAGTGNGLLLCLKTGDRDADGWSCWGGNAQHNKKD